MLCHNCNCIPFVGKGKKPIQVMGLDWCTPCWEEFLAGEAENEVELPSDSEVDQMLNELNKMHEELTEELEEQGDDE